MAAIFWLLPILRELGAGALHIPEIGVFQGKKETWHLLAF